MFLNYKNIIFEIRRSKVTDYAALKKLNELWIPIVFPPCKSNRDTSKSLGRDILFRSIERPNYREVDIRIYYPPPQKKMIMTSVFPSQTFVLCA